MTDLPVSSFYYQPRRDPIARATADAELRATIEQVQVQFPRYGYRRVRAALRRDGCVVNSKRLRRVMRAHGLCADIRKIFRTATTNSQHGFAVFPNVLPTVTITGPNQVWAADLTYIRIATGFVYLAVLLDLFSRKVIGWALAPTLHRELCCAALRMALTERPPPVGCLHHSDRGVQYACHEYVALLATHGLIGSMSRTGNPYDNAYVESFMKTLKHEEVLLNDYETMTDVIERVPIFLEDVYNTKRLHSALGYGTPVEYEAAYAARALTDCTPPLTL